jgi:transposase
MNEQALPPELGIPETDWEQTPASVRAVVLALYPLIEEVKDLKEEVAKLQEQLGVNSNNSSKPPSSDGPGQKIVKGKPKERGQKRGGQKGHKGHRRELLPIEQVDEMVEHKPETCATCGNMLEGQDPEPYRYQVTELPPIEPHVVEHQIHRLTCKCCGAENRGELPPEVAVSQFGPNLVALMAVLMGVYRLSKRQVTGLLEDCFDIRVSTGSVVNQQKAVSAVLEEPVEEALAYVQAQAVRNIDETGWYQRDQDKKGWLWVVVTPLVTVFLVALSRGGNIARALLGEESEGVVGSDRASAYNWLPPEQRQLCWAHLRRNFQRILERGGQSALVGAPLRLLAEEILMLWGRVRDGTLSQAEFLIRLPAFQHAIHHTLVEGAGCSHSKTAKTCRLILKVEPALWTFATHPGVEPTNNGAERALRTAVIWRGLSHGTQSEAGSRFVERILTVVETCRQQERNPLDYLRQTIIAHRKRLPSPSLLPDHQVFFTTP